MEIGRARLPSVSPDWTDHNAHDPGITLMELLAWTSEAQLYSLSRLRRDERLAYAALLGLTPAGTREARGLIWPDLTDPNSPISTFVRTVVIPHDAIIRLLGAETPVFRPADTLLWSPGRITSLTTRHADGSTTDHTRTNAGGELSFLPFGAAASRRDVLSMTFSSRDEHGLLGADPQRARKARWAIGVQAADSEPYVPGPTHESGRQSLRATLVIEGQRLPLRVVSDSSHGLLTTGAILLELTDVPALQGDVVLELQPIRALPRAPRTLCLQPNVVPIRQGRTISRELHVASGQPDWRFALNEPGLQFEMDSEPLTMEVVESDGLHRWTRHHRLSDCGPDDNVYELDTDASEVTFGNGVNGRIPPGDSQVMVSYSVSDGVEGSASRNRKWTVAGFEGVFGVNPVPIEGGASAPASDDIRREAMHRAREHHALVTAEDIAGAAKALPLLSVARAWVVQPPQHTPRTGVVTLVALRRRPAAGEALEVLETPQWLSVIQRTLRVRMPLGTRLAVVAPRYVDFSLQTVLEAHAGRDPTVVQQEVWKQLTNRLALIDSPAGAARQPGGDVTHDDVVAWIRSVDGVKRVSKLTLFDSHGRKLARVSVPSTGLPKWRRSTSAIDVTRSTTRSQP